MNIAYYNWRFEHKTTVNCLKIEQINVKLCLNLLGYIESENKKRKYLIN